VHENVGVAVKIMRNEFSNAGMDLNAWESGIYEYVPSIVGTYEIRDNIFNPGGFGLWDNWRYDHPENPDWMRMIWDHNTFNIVEDMANVGNMFGLKNAIFSNNKFQSGHLRVYGSWLSPEWDYYNYWRMWSEGCQFLNNVFQQKNFVIELHQTTMNCLIKGNLKNVTITNDGLNNKIIAKTN
jgi:hypothetical protein